MMDVFATEEDYLRFEMLFFFDNLPKLECPKIYSPYFKTVQETKRKIFLYECLGDSFIEFLQKKLEELEENND